MVCRLTPVEAVASGDEIAIEAMPGPVLAPGHIRLVAIDIVQGHVFGLHDDGGADRILGIVQIPGQFGLAVDHDLLAARLHEVDPEAAILRRQEDTFVHDSLRIHARARAGLADQFNAAPLQHPRANPRQHIFAAATLQHHGLDAGPVEQLR